MRAAHCERIVLGAPHQDAEASARTRLQILGPRGDEFGSAAERVVPDRHERPVTQPDDIVRGGGISASRRPQVRPSACAGRIGVARFARRSTILISYRAPNPETRTMNVRTKIAISSCQPAFLM